ncbi:uncharacterized protein LOC110989909 [Acanthaster planci]|uniref:Uncharacterized protein LOC110989909 n=1 Tax=Acanthaster planci TaxID=133434 RepID=A0A8B8A339_ACAPL|nr:uncharacterized protein LOC110989909 [Acanthaster planci]
MGPVKARSIPMLGLIITTIVLSGCGVLWTACSAQTTPQESPELLVRLREHFCTDADASSCKVQGDTICAGLCTTDLDQWFSCATTLSVTAPELCRDTNQVLQCPYSDGILCLYEDGRGLCVYSLATQPFCICGEGDEIFTSPIASDSLIPSQCLPPDETIDEPSTEPTQNEQTTLTSQTPSTMPDGQPSTPVQPDAPGTKAPGFVHTPAAVDGHATIQLPASVTTAAPSTTPETSTDVTVIVVVIVLVILLLLILLLVFLWRSGKLAKLFKKPSNESYTPGVPMN